MAKTVIIKNIFICVDTVVKASLKRFVILGKLIRCIIGKGGGANTDYLRTLATLHYLFICVFTGEVSGTSSVQVLPKKEGKHLKNLLIYLTFTV